MRISLASLNANGQAFANVAGQLTRVVDFQVPQGQFFALDTKRPQVVRLAAREETTGRAISTAERTNNALDAAALADTPVQPPSRYIPTWPNVDGYTFKVFIRHRHATLGPGPWTRATINAVNWGTRVLTLALPTTLVNHAGSAHTVVAGDLIDIRISYIFAGGQLIWRRETPDNAATVTARTAWDSDTYMLGVRDQYSEGGKLITNAIAIWVPQQCHWRWYINAPVPWDFDPTLSATTIELNGAMEDMARAHAAWHSMMQAMGLATTYRTLYGLYVAQLAGIEPEAYPT